MEKRNFVTSYRTPAEGITEKTASFDDCDEAIGECMSELAQKASEEDEKSDKEYFEKK